MQSSEKPPQNDVSEKQISKAASNERQEAPEMGGSVGLWNFEFPVLFLVV